MLALVFSLVVAPLVAAIPAPAPASVGSADFGGCPLPEIEFGLGFDGRKEASFRPKDLGAYSHGSAQNIKIISSFICDRVGSNCRGNADALNMCRQAEAAADSATPPKTGVQADAFNAVFGINTNFAAAGVGGDAGGNMGGNNGGNMGGNNGGNNGGNDGGAANFGNCPTPEIEFGLGFDGRKEASFRPKDLGAYSHGSAQNIKIISSFICDRVGSNCQGNAAALNMCRQAEAAADSATPPKTGVQADAFNAVFGINTSFGSGGGENAGAGGNNGGNMGGNNAGNNGCNGGNNGGNNGDNNGGNMGGNNGNNNGGNNGGNNGAGVNFGNCPAPQIEFAAGFDGRRETSFRPTDLGNYNHGSAQNINIITRFICDRVNDGCKGSSDAVALCRQAADVAGNTQPAKSGAQADAFNAMFGFQTNFANVQVVA